jgi:hypothetical protein
LNSGQVCVTKFINSTRPDTFKIKAEQICCFQEFGYFKKLEALSLDVLDFVTALFVDLKLAAPMADFVTALLVKLPSGVVDTALPVVAGQ